MTENSYTFCPKSAADIKTFIDSSTSTSIIGIPGVGISIFLKYLASQSFGYSIYIDVFGLPKYTPAEFFFTLLSKLGGDTDEKDVSELVALCKHKLENLIERNERVIIYIAGFDQLKRSFNQEFFNYLRSLRNSNENKIIFIFGSCRRIDSLVSENIMDTDLNMLSSIYYLKPYDDKDIEYMLSLYGPKIATIAARKATNVAGGHFQLVQLLLRSERIHDPLRDPFIKVSLRNIYQHLNYQQKNILKKVASQNINDIDDPYLVNVGLVKKVDNSYQIFSPLFASFLKTQISLKLPIKEARLLKILHKNIGNVVAKDELISAVWGDELDKASDWALDSLLYRLRRNPVFISRGLIIENHKKQGYTLIKN